MYLIIRSVGAVLLLLQFALALPVSTCIQSVMTIILENESRSNVMQDNYFGVELPSKGYLLTNMNGITHPSQPNYIAMVSGDTHNVINDSVYDLNVRSIADILEEKGLTWKSYQENYPADGACHTDKIIGGAHSYARKHNPFMSFVNINRNATRCSKHIVNSSDLDADATSRLLPHYMFYTPNLIHDGHDSNIPTCSKWLKDFLEPKLVDPVFSNTLFWITFDESDGFIPGTPNPIYGILVGAGIKGRGLMDSTSYNHYNLLATVEHLFQVGNMGRNDVNAIPFPVGSLC